MGAFAASTVTTDRAALGEYLGLDLVPLADELPAALLDAISELEAGDMPSLAEAVRLCARRAGIALPKGGK